MSGLRLSFSCKLILLSLVLAICMVKVKADESVDKLEVKIYYEALCSDSVHFIKNQLQSSMSTKGRYKYADLVFVPYGHVVSYNDTKTKQKVLICQHGHRECELNALHACIIENNTERESYDMIVCMMRGLRTSVSQCATRLGIDLDEAKKCKDSRTIADILETYGEDTDTINPSFVPTITIDGVYDYNEQDEILRRFDKVFCRKYKAKFNVTLAGC